MAQDYITGHNDGLILGLSMNARLTVGGGTSSSWAWWRELDMTTCQNYTPPSTLCEFPNAENYNSIAYTHHSCESVLAFVSFLEGIGFTDTTRKIWLEGTTTATKGKIHRVGYTMKCPGSDFLFIIANCAHDANGIHTSSSANTYFRFSISNGSILLSAQAFTVSGTTPTIGFEYVRCGGVGFMREVTMANDKKFTPFTLTVRINGATQTSLCYTLNPTTSQLKYYAHGLYALYPDLKDEELHLKPLYYMHNVYTDDKKGILNKTLSYVQLVGYDKRVLAETLDEHTHNIYVGLGCPITFTSHTFVSIEGDPYYILDVGGNKEYGAVLSVLKC